VTPALALGAVGAVFLTSTCGVLGQVVGDERLTGGPAGKADRVLVVAAGAAVAGVAADSVPLEVTAWLLLVGAAATICLRVRELHRIVGRNDAR
jgi:hypothetical protein